MPHPLTLHLQAALGQLPQNLAELIASAQQRPLASGEALLCEGDRWTHLWWIEQGSFRLYYLDRNGRAANKNFYLEGAMVWPITPTLAREPSRFWVEALEASQVWTLPWATWSAPARQFDPWQTLERQVLAKLLEDKMSREQQFLQNTATERYENLLTSHPDWAARIPLRHLASYLGITDVALSRIRRRLGARPPEHGLNPG
jgi:CRP-like cAMP-binding protein